MPIQYLDIELMEKMCHKLAVAVFDATDDPIAHFHEHSDLLDSALNLPKQTFDGKDLYPTLVDKAAILYYALNKNHPLENKTESIENSMAIREQMENVNAGMVRAEIRLNNLGNEVEEIRKHQIAHTIYRDELEKLEGKVKALEKIVMEKLS